MINRACESTTVSLIPTETTTDFIYYVGDPLKEVIMLAFGITSDTGNCDQSYISYSVAIAGTNSIITIPNSFTASDQEPVKLQWSTSKDELVGKSFIATVTASVTITGDGTPITSTLDSIFTISVQSLCQSGQITPVLLE